MARRRKILLMKPKEIIEGERQQGWVCFRRADSNANSSSTKGEEGEENPCIP